MHKLEIIDQNVDLDDLQLFMCEHSEFILTQKNVHNDLSTCVISLHTPNIVCKVLKFRLYKKEDAIAFEKWKQQRRQAEENKRIAKEMGISVREYIENVKKMVYDREFDEPRLIAKVPGMNVFLELYGMLYLLDPADYEGKRKQLDDIKQKMQKASVWYRTQQKMDHVRQHGSSIEDEQLLDSWHESLNDKEYFKRPPYRGIGYEDIDESRREPIGPRHPFNQDEIDEYKKLKKDLYPDLSLAEIRQMAASNVASRKTMK